MLVREHPADEDATPTDPSAPSSPAPECNPNPTAPVRPPVESYRHGGTRFLVLGLCTMMTIACGDVLAGPQELPGRYHLESMDGSPLPYSLEESVEVSIEVTDGQIDLEEDGDFTMNLFLRYFDENTEELGVETTVGSWRRSGSQLTLIDSFGVTRFGTVDGHRMTISGDPVFDFVR